MKNMETEIQYKIENLQTRLWNVYQACSGGDANLWIEGRYEMADIAEAMAIEIGKLQQVRTQKFYELAKSGGRLVNK